METGNVRAEALRRLLRIEEAGAYIGVDDEKSGGGREARQALEYVAGVTRWRRYLDFVLAQFYRGEVDRLEPTLRMILRIGLYELLFLDSADYAAVNEAVDLAKKHVRKGAGGLVNGVLRNVLRQKDELALPDTFEDF
ncbi:MAG: transcription antitermination factor NusB, partial [Rhodothermales bacterium]